MNLFKTDSVQHRLTLGLTAVITLILILFSVFIIFSNSRRIEEQLQNQLDKITSFSEESLSIALWQYNFTYINKYIESLFLYDDIAFASIIVKGKEIEKKIRTDFKEFSFITFQKSPKFISRETKIIYKGTEVGALQLVLSRNRIQALIISSSMISIFILCLINIAIFGTNYLISKWYLFNPLSKLEASVKLISAGNLNVKIDASGKDEIGQLANSFKQMMNNLKKITASRNELNKEISNRKLAEKQIKSSLKEKETLLHEIHHRVKNNLAVISSLLSLQAIHMKDEKLKEALTDSRNRIQTMATIHETLYQSDNLAAIDMDTYLLKLASNIFQSHINRDRINLNVEAGNIVIETKQASSIGLIINELISNSLKHAFPDNQTGEINISLEKLSMDKIQIIYVDNGIGLPEKINWKESDSLGLQLIRTLVEEQLDGTIKLKIDKGTCFVIEFDLL